MRAYIETNISKRKLFLESPKQKNQNKTKQNKTIQLKRKIIANHIDRCIDKDRAPGNKETTRQRISGIHSS